MTLCPNAVRFILNHFAETAPPIVMMVIVKLYQHTFYLPLVKKAKIRYTQI